MIYFWSDSRTVCVRLYTRMSVQSKVLATWVKSGRKVGEESTKPLGFTMPHYFYMHNISLDDFGAIQTARGGIYIFTTGTPYKISSRALLLSPLRTGIFTVECPCPESFRSKFQLFCASHQSLPLLIMQGPSSSHDYRIPSTQRTLHDDSTISYSTWIVEAVPSTLLIFRNTEIPTDLHSS